MGCSSSTPVKDELHQHSSGSGTTGKAQDLKPVPKLPPQVEAALAGANRRGVSFAGDVRDTPTRSKDKNADKDSDLSESPSRAVSITGRNSRSSLVAKREKSFVGADLPAIMDDHGMLNPLVSRQLSIMSHYSVRSESGSVMITPEDAEAPFRLIRLIGRGGVGNVYLGEWEGDRVAIKIIAGNTNADAPEEQEWEARKERMAQMEAILMSAINHPNIVRTFKVTSHSGEHLDPELLLVERQLLAGSGGETENGVPSFEWHILMEYCDRGSLSKALASFRLHEPVDAGTVKWDAWASIEVLKEIVSALIFLHEHNILHGDLKAANVLLASSDEDRRRWIAKVADFGLARVLKDKDHIKTQTFGTVTHMPPELLAKGTLSPSSDVYAVGVLMWEIFTSEKVFKQLSDSEVILAVVTKKARPTFPPDCPSRFRFLAERCWADIPEMRPSLDTLLNELETLQDQLCPQGPETSRIPVKIFPSRQKHLDQYRAQLAAAAAAAAAAAGTAQPGSPVASSAQGNSQPTRPPPPNLVPNNRVQKLSAHKQRKSASETKPGSPLSRGSGQVPGGAIPVAPDSAMKRAKSQAGEAQSPAGSITNMGDARCNSSGGGMLPQHVAPQSVSSPRNMQSPLGMHGSAQSSQTGAAK